MSVQCTVEFTDGERIEKTSQVTGHGKEYLSSLSSILSTMKEDVNTVLSEQVERERKQPSQPLKRPTTDDDDDDEEDVEDESDTPPDSKTQRT